MSEPLVSVTLPGERYMGVARLVTAGIGARLDLSFETVDDLQLAVELVLAAAFGEQVGGTTVAFASDDAALTISVSPLADSILRTTRAGYDGETRVQLRELLDRLVDSVATESEPVPAIVLRKEFEASRP